MAKARLGTCTTDGSGLTVSLQSVYKPCNRFMPSWVGLPMVFGGTTAKISSVAPDGHTLVLETAVGPFATPTDFYPNRETIYQAVFQRVKDLGLFNTASRRPRPISELGPEEHPALFMEQRGEDPHELTGTQYMPYRWDMYAMFAIYCYDGNDQAIPVKELNIIMDAVENAFTPQPEFTLDGLVSTVRMSGKLRGLTGSLGPRAWAFFPVRIQAI